MFRRLHFLIPLILATLSTPSRAEYVPYVLGCPALLVAELKPADFASHTPQATALREEIKKAEALLAGALAAAKDGSSFTFPEQGKEIWIYLARGGVQNHNTIRDNPSTQDAALEFDFSQKTATLHYRSLGQDFQVRIADEKVKRLWDEGVESRLPERISSLKHDLRDPKNFTPDELRAILAEIKKSQVYLLKQTTLKESFYHVTRDAKSKRAILKKGLEFGGGDMGASVYAVSSEHQKALLKFAREAGWSTSPRSNLLELKLNPNAKIFDFDSDLGRFAFKVFMELNPNTHLNESQRISEFAETIGADILFYGWRAAPALAIKNKAVIESVKPAEK